MALGLSLLCASGALAAVAHHDGVGLSASDAAHEPVGSEVRLRGQPVTQAAVALSPLAALLPVESRSRLENFTYTIDAGDAVLWLTSAVPRPAGETAIIEGTVVARAQTTEPQPRPVAVVRVSSWTQPILFR